MDSLQAFILGLIQGLTEFLPVSSSGHLVIGKALFGIESENLSFEVAVHCATVLATIVAFRKEIWDLLTGLFKFKYNEQTDYICKIAVSMIPVGIVGVLFKDWVEELFGSGLLIVGSMLCLTAVLLFVSDRVSAAREEKNETGSDVTYKSALIIGIAQAFAVLPGLSRSGSTISAGLLCGVKKSAVAQFSFLMVLVPILGEAFLDAVGGEFGAAASGISATSLAVGSITAFISGYAACRWMIGIVRRARLYWFSIYCLVAGSLAIILGIN